MKINNRQQLLLIVTIVAGALFAADKLMITPLTHVWTARRQEVTQLRKQVADGTSLIRRERAVRDHWDLMRTNTLPNNQSFAQEMVLKALETWSQESGTSLNGSTTQWKQDTDEYKTLACRVDASGSLWALSRFIYDIEKGPLGLKLESVELNSHDNTGQQLSLGLQISGLVLTPQGK